jgi:hypothetical protein
MLHLVKFTHLKYIIQWFFINFAKRLLCHHESVLKHFHSLNIRFIPMNSLSLFTPIPHVTTCLLTLLQTCLFLTFYDTNISQMLGIRLHLFERKELKKLDSESFSSPFSRREKWLSLGSKQTKEDMGYGLVLIMGPHSKSDIDRNIIPTCEVLLGEWTWFRVISGIQT